MTSCVSLQQKAREIRELLRGGERRRRLLLRQAASVVDVIGAVGFYMGLAIFLSIHESSGIYEIVTGKSTLHYCFFPLWISVVVSTSMRFFTYLIPGADSPRYLRMSGPLYTFANSMIILMIRGAQPLLILLKLYGAIDENWSAVFAPGWIMIFVGVGLSTLCMATSSSVHPYTSPQLKGQATTFIGLWSAHVVVASLSLLLFLTWLTQRLDDDRDAKTVHSGPVILAPLIAAFAIFSFLDPWLRRAVSRYQVRNHGNNIMRNYNATLSGIRPPSGPGCGSGSELGSLWNSPLISIFEFRIAPLS